MSPIQWTAYILSTLLINIVGLNLLISVIGDVYAKVTAKLNAIDYKARLEQILEIEKEIYNINRDGVKDDFSRQYLHYIHYAEDSGVEDLNQRKANLIKDQIGELNERLDQRVKGITERDAELEAKLRELLPLIRNQQ